MDEDKVDPSELFSSPIKPSDLPSQQRIPRTPKTPTPQDSKEKQPFDADERREAALRRELEGVRNINNVIEGVIGTLERAKGNMGNVSQTVNNASTLLNTWTRILSQTEHSQRLILNKDWKGATDDLEELQHARIEEERAAQRRAAELERQRDEALRRVEEQEQRGLGGGTTTGRGARAGARGTTTTRSVGRGGLARGGASAGGVGAATGSGVSGSRAGSQIGRGFGAGRTTRTTRGVGRGTK